LANMPIVQDPSVRAIIGLCNDMLSCSYHSRPWVFDWLVLRALSFSLRYGNTEESCSAYSCYGVLLVSLYEDIPSAFQFSEMSLRLNEALNDAKQRGRLLFLHGVFINSWRRPFATNLPIMEHAFRACLEVGDLVYACFNGIVSTLNALEKGGPFDQVLEV